MYKFVNFGFFFVVASGSSSSADTSQSSTPTHSGNNGASNHNNMAVTNGDRVKPAGDALEDMLVQLEDYAPTVSTVWRFRQARMQGGASHPPKSQSDKNREKRKKKSQNQENLPKLLQCCVQMGQK